MRHLKLNQKKQFVTALILFFIIFSVGCSRKLTPTEKASSITDSNNPFFSPFHTPFSVPPFDKIKEQHFLPAFQKGMSLHMQEIETIASNPQPPSFENTIAELDRAGSLLTTVSNIFYSLKSAHTNDKIQHIANEVAPLLAKHNDDIRLNQKLFRRIKTLYDKADTLDLTTEQNRLLEKNYQDFVRGGANLDQSGQEQLRAINKELSLLGLKFGDNLLKETNNFKMLIDKKEDLAGLPSSVIDAAAEAANASGDKGKWLFTLHKPSWIPFLQYSERRDLREKLYKGYINRGDNDNEYDNKKIIAQIAALRVKKAKLLGYETFADYRLEINMAKNPENVLNLLNKLWDAALPKAKEEAKSLQALIDREEHKFKLASWDWWYYTEKLRKEKYNFDDESLRPYFELNNVREGAFYVANRLYGLEFKPVPTLPVYHRDVKVFEVSEADGTHVGLLYVDYFPRPSKRGGAWCGSFRKQSRKFGENIHPLVTNVCNFSKPTVDKPALLSFDEVETLFHEFGHALHNLLSDCTYETLAATAVARDFVELPSQIMEHWASEPELLKIYAKHYQTGEVIPQELIDKLKRSRNFNQGFITVEYLAAALLDIHWHTLKEATVVDTNQFEEEFLNKIGLIPEIISRYRSTYFAHIVGGYAAGYYAYIWAGVLDCDAYEAFEEKDIFDSKTAGNFRKYILSKGGTDDPMVLYKKFRGSEPKIDALLKNRGLL